MWKYILNVKIHIKPLEHSVHSIHVSCCFNIIPVHHLCFQLSTRYKQSVNKCFWSSCYGQDAEARAACVTEGIPGRMNESIRQHQSYYLLGSGSYPKVVKLLKWTENCPVLALGRRSIRSQRGLWSLHQQSEEPLPGCLLTHASVRRQHFLGLLLKFISPLLPSLIPTIV